MSLVKGAHWEVVLLSKNSSNLVIIIRVLSEPSGWVGGWVGLLEHVPNPTIVFIVKYDILSIMLRWVVHERERERVIVYDRCKL